MPLHTSRLHEDTTKPHTRKSEEGLISVLRFSLPFAKSQATPSGPSWSSVMEPETEAWGQDSATVGQEAQMFPSPKPRTLRRTNSMFAERVGRTGRQAGRSQRERAWQLPWQLLALARPVAVAPRGQQEGLKRRAPSSRSLPQAPQCPPPPPSARLANPVVTFSGLGVQCPCSASQSQHQFICPGQTRRP